MSIRTLLNAESQQLFVEQYYGRLPYSLAGAAKSLCGLGTWSRLGQILASDGVDVMVVRRGQRSTAEPRSASEAQALADDGYTVLVRHAERHDADLDQLARGFAADFAAPVNIHLYATPADQFGFGWHYDAEEVFIVQTHGSKEYSLRKNTVHPWPLVETLPQDMGYQNELMPLIRCRLQAGDWLYIPCGYWHRAAADEMAISLAIGVLAPAAITLLDFLRPRLLQDLVWRQRLPVTGKASAMDRDALKSHLQQLVAHLGRDLQRVLDEPQWLDDFLDDLTTQIPASPTPRTPHSDVE